MCTSSMWHSLCSQSWFGIIVNRTDDCLWDGQVHFVDSALTGRQLVCVSVLSAVILGSINTDKSSASKC